MRFLPAFPRLRALLGLRPLSATMPADASERVKREVEVTELRWVAIHWLELHARHSGGEQCLCPICRVARRYVNPPPAACLNRWPIPPVAPQEKAPVPGEADHG